MNSLDIHNFTPSFFPDWVTLYVFLRIFSAFDQSVIRGSDYCCAQPINRPGEGYINFKNLVSFKDAFLVNSTTNQVIVQYGECG